MTPAEIQQLAAFNGLIAAIASTNRFYQPKLAEAGGRAGFGSLVEFCARTPFTTKDALVRDQLENPPYGSNLTYPLKSYTRYHQTSGTGGRPLIWLDNPESWQWVLDNWKCGWQQAGALRGDAAFFAFSLGPFLGFWAVGPAVRSVAGVRDYQVEIDKRSTLPEVTVRFEANDDRDPTSELAKHLRATFQMRLGVERVPAGTLPVFEMKARRWKVPT